MQKEQTYRAWLWIFVVIILIGAVAAMVRLVQTSDGQGTRDTSSILASITPEDWVLGNASSTVTITEYGDFQCPACASYEPLLRAIEKEYSTRVRFVFRHFPLQQHPNARPAAMATEAAGAQGKFWEMHDLIYDKQRDWETSSNAEAIFITYAETLKLSVNAFKDGLNSKVLSRKISDSYQSGLLFNVNGTPTFFLNNEKIDTPRNLVEFKTLLDNALNATTTTK